MNYVLNVNKDDLQAADKGSYAVNNNNVLMKDINMGIFLNRRKQSVYSRNAFTETQ